MIQLHVIHDLSQNVETPNLRHMFTAEPALIELWLSRKLEEIENEPESHIIRTLNLKCLRRLKIVSC